MSAIEELLALQIRATKLPFPEREFRFDLTRRWRSDFAWPWQMLLVEVEGGTWTGGRHTRGRGFAEDCAKYNSAALNGWMVLRFTSDQIKSGEAISTIEMAINSSKYSKIAKEIDHEKKCE